VPPAAITGLHHRRFPKIKHVAHQNLPSCPVAYEAICYRALTACASVPRTQPGRHRLRLTLGPDRGDPARGKGYWSHRWRFGTSQFGSRESKKAREITRIFLTGSSNLVLSRIDGLNSLIHSASSQYRHPVPETVSPLLESLLKDSPFTHVVSAHSAFSKSLLPRVAARVDSPPVSDVTSLEHDPSSNSTTFTRPIYAGNAIATVKAPPSVNVKFFTVRTTAFKAAGEGNSEAEVKQVNPIEVDSPTEHVKTELAKSDRPDLGSASRVVSGGRALKNSETFQKTLDPLADLLGAAVGASRAAVDAGYADNSLQVGQTGKVVAPELYMALGISGAIQHLAGMKDSKLIVAINKVSVYTRREANFQLKPPRSGP
jgi:electron transfer flavoprotein alpha subunit